MATAGHGPATRPADGGRRSVGERVRTARGGLRGPRPGDEGELGVPQREHVSVRQRRLGGDRRPVDQGAVATAQVLGDPPPVAHPQREVLAGHRGVGDGDGDLRRPADHPLGGTFEGEGLPLAGSGRAGQPCRSAIALGHGGLGARTRRRRASGDVLGRRARRRRPAAAGSGRGAAPLTRRGRRPWSTAGRRRRFRHGGTRSSRTGAKDDD